MQGSVYQIVSWRKAILPISINKREILQMGIIIESDKVEHHQTKKRATSMGAALTY